MYGVYVPFFVSLELKGMWKEHIGKFFLILFSLCFMFGIVGAEYYRETGGEEPHIIFQVGKEVVQVWEKENIYYLFLPSYASLKDIRLAPYSAKICVMKEGKPYEITESAELLTGMDKVQCQFIDSGKNFELRILKSANIPAVFIETKFGGVEDIKADKEHEVPGTIVTIDSMGERSRENVVRAIGGRGNTSFAGYDKKPYSLTLDEETSLLGLPSGKKYALISNASDPSLVRNDLARRMEETLELKYAHAGCFVDLYINGEYEGNYYFCDDIEIGTERINIPDMEIAMDLLYQKSGYEVEELYETDNVKARKLEVNPADITGGYLMEREYEQRFWLEYEEIGSSFVTAQKEHFVMKDPKYCSVEQIEYIYQYVNDAEKALMSEEGIHPENGKSYEEYLDVDSFVKKYLVEEVTKNYDAGVSSSYYYKDSDRNGGKLFAGPGWDYDMSLGNYVEWMEEFSGDPTGISKLAYHTYASPWHAKLYEKEEYYEKVKEYYREYVSPFLEEFLTVGIWEYQSELAASARMNQVRWEEELKENVYYENRAETFFDLKEFVTKRKMYLDEAWGK